MANIGAKLQISPEIIQKLSSGKGGLWVAAHQDGSDNRINGEAIMDAAACSTFLGILTGIFQALKKAFRNRGKTKEDFAAEKEAANINVSCAALEAKLLDYLRSAQQGKADEEDLDDLIATLKEIRGYALAGKLKVSGEKELAQIGQSIANCTAAMTGSKAPGPVWKPGTPVADQFRAVGELLIQQKKWIAGK